MINMKMKCALLWLLLPVMTYAQETKKVVLKTKGGDSQTYYVLKSAPAVRHGSYQSASSGHVILTGYYKNGKEDSVWTRYDWSGQIVWQGSYSNGEKAGVWIYNSWNGELEQKYDWTWKEVVLDKSTLFSKLNEDYRIVADTVPGDKVTPPIYIGGGSAAMRYVVNTINYPDSARENDVSGKVSIQLKLDANGNTSDYKVTKSVAHDLDGEALRVIKLIPENWIAATVNGKPVPSVITIPVTFKLAN